MTLASGDLPRLTYDDGSEALDVLSQKTYVVMQRRGAPPVPGRRVLGQRALYVPTIALTSQHTLSDGENFTEGYRTLGLGKVGGEATAGWDVYTSAGTMVDGTTVRLPFMTNAQLDRTPLELRSRAVYIAVDRPMGESHTGKDSQVERAVAELLKLISGQRYARGGGTRGGRHHATSPVMKSARAGNTKYRTVPSPDTAPLPNRWLSPMLPPRTASA